MTSPTTRSTRTDKLFPYTTLFPSTPHLRKSLMKLFVRTSAFFAAVLIATGTIAGVGQANAKTNPLESQIRAILDANPEIVVNALNKHQANQQRMQADQLAASARQVAAAMHKGEAANRKRDGT